MSCPRCGYNEPPPEPPVGTWVKDRHGAVSLRQDGGWAPPGCYPGGKWDRMWDARGPLVECGRPWGAEKDGAT